MKEIIWFIIIGISAGVLGGMGMGGGTILIPLLGIFCAVEQHSAQAINLIAFIPTSIVAIIIHSKNKLIKTKGIWALMISGVIFSIIGSFIGKSIQGEILGRIFGGFLILLSFVCFFSDKISAFIERKKSQKHST